MATETLNLWDTDPNRLDQELFDHPGNYYEVAKDVADAQRTADYASTQVDVAKEDLKRTDADLYVSILAQPDYYKVPAGARGTPTEKCVESAVLLQPSHVSAFQTWVSACNKLSDAEHDLGIKKAALGAMDCKKQTLGKGVELHLSNYRSTPRVSDDVRRSSATFEPSTRRAPE